MNNSEDFFAKQRRVSPPDSVADDVEQAVMSHVRKHRPSRISHPRRFVAATLGIVVVLALIGTFVQRDVSTAIPAKKNLEFVESKIILDNHVAIWLEPIDAQEKQK
ncbi:hypothetical protein KKG05_02335 [bacterium]|nr:hypothetical protein [bacterium]